MYETGVDYRVLKRILNWIQTNALRSNFDFYFEEEPRSHKDSQRIYRGATLLKVAAWLDHPLARNESVIKRVMQYQDVSGGVFNYIGDETKDIKKPQTIGALDTTFFGHLMVALNQRERAIRAGDWVLKFVEANAKPMRDNGTLYCNMDLNGKLVTDTDPDDPNSTINLVDRAQPTWQTGTIMAYLSCLYDTMRTVWGFADSEAERFLKGTFPVIEFESKMPHYTYAWPSKCKVAWGAGELLRVLLKHKKGTPELIEKAYTAAKNTVVLTFLDNQLPFGGWVNEHYPLSKSIPEYYYDYKPIKGISSVPDKPTNNADVKTIYLPAEEITGENVAEMKSAEKGIEAYLNSYMDLT